jgi:hypothetical protein
MGYTHLSGWFLIDKGVEYDYYGYMILAHKTYTVSQHKVTKGVYIVREEHRKSFEREMFMYEYNDKTNSRKDPPDW